MTLLPIPSAPPALQPRRRLPLTVVPRFARRTVSLTSSPLKKKGGMPGSARLRDCEILRNMMVKHAEEKRLYGAICAAPAIALKPWGLLKQKQMTGHPAFMEQLPTFWAVKSNVQVSGELTTSRGPGTTFEFALSFVKQMFGDNMGEELGRMLRVTQAQWLRLPSCDLEVTGSNPETASLYAGIRLRTSDPPQYPPHWWEPRALGHSRCAIGSAHCEVAGSKLWGKIGTKILEAQLVLKLQGSKLIGLQVAMTNGPTCVHTRIGTGNGRNTAKNL